MAEFIGARISLVSRSDIRYVGTLHEINSETSTVALENVTSFGTEGRKGNPDEEIPPSEAMYEYIVFRGSDVKDLRIEEAPAAKENKPPQVPNDPAIMSSSGSRPPPQAQAQAVQHQPPQGPPQGQQPPTSQGPTPPGGHPFAHHQYPPPFYPPPGGGWGGRGGPPGPPGPPFPPMPYGAPPGWYPPPGGQHGFPPGHFPPYGYPPGPPGQQQFQQGQQQKPAPIGPGANKQTSGPSTPAADKEVEPKSLAKPVAEMAAAAVTAPTPPVASKPSPSEVQAAVEQTTAAQSAATAAASKTAPTGPKRIQPVIPLHSPATTKITLQGSSSNVVSPPAAAGTTPASLRDATQAATAAVAAAMAKLPQANGNSIEHLTKKVNEMRTNDPVRAPRHPGATGGFERGRGRGRGGARTTAQKVDVPATDFDFESSNAKFNKQDLVKEAIAGSPLAENGPSSSPTEPETLAPGYNKTKSFFDDISSESKERAEGGGGRPGGREWRGEEQKKNVETFGQGSVDNGFRGGFRGRGRGRGYRGRGYGGNGQSHRGRGGYRGNEAQTAQGSS